LADADKSPTKPKLLGRELAVRVASAIAIIVVAGTALWLGGWFWMGFVALVAGGVLWEWNGLVRQFEIAPLAEVVWLFFGAIYVGAAALAMVSVREDYVPLFVMLGFFLPIVAVDVGAYFSGRILGGPKIAPAISPSKTWAGLLGGALAASLVALWIEYTYPEAGQFGPASADGPGTLNIVGVIVAGCLIAVLAQAGDFFESWMKRRAGVKDSGSLIPGHGGLFDRLDGFLAVFFVLALMRFIV
jgi:phosphatidate cytidylyltransferase